MSYKKIYCVKCGFKHQSIDGWRHRVWETESGPVEGWGCYKVSMPEFIPDRIKDERRKYAKDTLQPHREGVPSREFIKEYPNQAKKMFTKKEIKNAKNVWK